MGSIRLPANYNGVEAMIHLSAPGHVETRREPDALVLIADERTDAQLAATFDGWTPEPTFDPSRPPAEVLQAVAFLRQRADAGDNVARAVLVCLRYVNARLE